MKRIWVALTLMTVCISLAISEFLIVKNKTEYFLEEISTANYYFSKKEYNISTEILDSLRKKWENSEKALNVFLSHEKVDEIEESLSELSQYCEQKELPRFQATFEKTKRQLLCLKQSELPNLENIL